MNINPFHPAIVGDHLLANSKIQLEGVTGFTDLRHVSDTTDANLEY